MTELARIATTTPTTTPPADPLRQVVTWIISGFSEAEVVEAVEQTWPDRLFQLSRLLIEMTLRKGRPLIVEALKQIEKQGDANAQLVKGFAVEGTRLIYQRALEAGDHPTALRALRQLVDLTR